ncbi:TlpA family protein disulfide reductase [Tamlana sp. I1]|uniref:TlpA family protein disulfide reductase n=1 Tax=Tamlana sp. I1 TaxID=2762061 RepID=UPI00188DFC39|nr:TlpA disulfide reductase family protein [Tamlana sp. I1]
MKKIIYVLALSVALVACKTEPQKDYVVFKGTISNKISDHISVNSLMSSFKKQIKLNEDGSFLDTLNIKADNLMIFDQRNLSYMYVEAGQDLHLSYDAEDLKNTIHFKGVGSEINNYLIAKRNKDSELSKKSGNIYELGESEFLKAQKEIESALLELLKNTPNLPETYKEKEKRNIKYGYLSELDSYEANHAYYTKNPDFKVSDGFLKELYDLDYNNETDYDFSYGYYTLVTNFCRREAQQESKLDNVPNDVAYLNTVNKLSSQSIKNDLLFKHAKSGITFTSDLEDYYKAYMNGSTNVAHNEEITKSYNELKKVDKGALSPKFVNYENHAGGTTSLDDLKGKYVYIDVWATWCGPCKSEIPFLKEVEKKYHDKNIEFVSISVDKTRDHAKWKKMVDDENLGGIQLIADNDFKSQFVQDYFIKGIPKFILLDPNGYIVTPNAPRPSNKKLIELLDALDI